MPLSYSASVAVWHACALLCASLRCASLRPLGARPAAVACTDARLPPSSRIAPTAWRLLARSGRLVGKARRVRCGCAVLFGCCGVVWVGCGGPETNGERRTDSRRRAAKPPVSGRYGPGGRRPRRMICPPLPCPRPPLLLPFALSTDVFPSPLLLPFPFSLSLSLFPFPFLFFPRRLPLAFRRRGDRSDRTATKTKTNKQKGNKLKQTKQNSKEKINKKINKGETTVFSTQNKQV